MLSLRARVDLGRMAEKGVHHIPPKHQQLLESDFQDTNKSFILTRSVNKKKKKKVKGSSSIGFCRFGGHTLKMKESEKMDKNLGLAIELKKQ